MCKLIIFDFDGTIADTSKGIIDSFRCVGEHYGKKGWSDEKIIRNIGNPLPFNLKKMYGLSDSELTEAIAVYRSYYSEEAYDKVSLYPGFIELIKDLSEKGMLMAVATLKANKIVQKMMKMLDIDCYFDSINGVGDADAESKADLIDRAITHAGVERRSVVMVGDAVSDYESSIACGVKFVAAIYGFGISVDYCVNHRIKYISKVTDLMRVVCE